MGGGNCEWRRLGEIGTFIRGNGLTKKDFIEDGVGCIHYGQIYTYYDTKVYNTKSFVSPELAKKLIKVKTNDLIITTTSENVEDICKCVAWLGEDEIVTGGHACVFHHNENASYLSYYFQTFAFYDQKKKYAYGEKVTDIKIKDLEKILIPIPPLSEQERIAGFLDRFEELTNGMESGLPAEIRGRRKQYEWYRERIFEVMR